MHVCIVGNVLTYPRGGGHLWAYLNWALGLKELGCEVTWLEPVGGADPDPVKRDLVRHLRALLERYGVGDRLALASIEDVPLPEVIAREGLSVDEAAEADLLLSLHYGLSRRLVSRFRRKALISIDPGLLEGWLRTGVVRIAPYDVHFTTAAPVGGADLLWQPTRPCVALSAWPASPPPPAGAFTSVTQWYGGEWVVDGNESYSNDKRDGYLPYIDLPRRTRARLELAIGGLDDWTRSELEPHGWQLREAHDVAATPWAYQDYIAGSLGEFSCVKPSCVRLRNGWLSDRTLGYLATGRPVVVQDTGPADDVPDGAGLLRFRTLEEAVRALEAVAEEPVRHGAAARQIAERFAAHRVVGSVLERALA